MVTRLVLARLSAGCCRLAPAGYAQVNRAAFLAGPASTAITRVLRPRRAVRRSNRKAELSMRRIKKHARGGCHFATRGCYGSAVVKVRQDQNWGLGMTSMRARPSIVPRGAESCTSCGARSASVCAAIEEKDLERLAALAVPLPVPPGRTFITEGDPAEHFFNVTRGTAKLFKLLPDGRRQVTGFASAGTFLGLAVSSSYAFSAEAVEPAQVCRFSRTRLRHLLDDFPAMERRLLDVASNELVAAQEQMLLLGRKTARERVASFLLARESCATACHVPPVRGHISLPMARTDIADYLGLTVETVSRTMTRLRTEKLIDMPSPTEIVLRNHAALAELAAGLS